MFKKPISPVKYKPKISSPLTKEFPVIRDISLHEAVATDDHRAIKMLISSTNIDGPDEEGHTPLIKAIITGHNDAAKILMDNGADLNICDSANNSPLLIALTTKNLEIARIIANEYSYEDKIVDLENAIEFARINYEDQVGLIQLFLDAKIFECGSVADLTDSLDEGANINAINNEGDTVFISAIKERASVGSIYFLIASGVKFNPETTSILIKNLIEANGKKAKALSDNAESLIAKGLELSDELKIKFNSVLRNREELMQYDRAIKDDNMIKLNQMNQYLLENEIPMNIITSLISNPHDSRIEPSLLRNISRLLINIDTSLGLYKDLANSISDFIIENESDLDPVELDEEDEISPPSRVQTKDKKDLRKLLLTREVSRAMGK